ncbi:hypothetical protein SOVF_003640 [Spinacia oleracea]|nr:hypothetical protein SOVF_003640 [Spinacia oleracea]
MGKSYGILIPSFFLSRHHRAATTINHHNSHRPPPFPPLFDHHPSTTRPARNTTVLNHRPLLPRFALPCLSPFLFAAPPAPTPHHTPPPPATLAISSTTSALNSGVPPPKTTQKQTRISPVFTHFVLHFLSPSPFLCHQTTAITVATHLRRPARHPVGHLLPPLFPVLCSVVPLPLLSCRSSTAQPPPSPSHPTPSRPADHLSLPSSSLSSPALLRAPSPVSIPFPRRTENQVS